MSNVDSVTHKNKSLLYKKNESAYFYAKVHIHDCFVFYAHCKKNWCKVYGSQLYQNLSFRPQDKILDNSG